MSTWTLSFAALIGYKYVSLDAALQIGGPNVSLPIGQHNIGSSNFKLHFHYNKTTAVPVYDISVRASLLAPTRVE